MKLFIDERIVPHTAADEIFDLWLAIDSDVQKREPKIPISVKDALLVDGNFLRRLNSIASGKRRLVAGLVFGSRLGKWRNSASCTFECQLDTESEPVRQCGVSEATKVAEAGHHAGVLGSSSSSYAGRSTVSSSSSTHTTSELRSITTLEQFAGTAKIWGSDYPGYDTALKRPPRDEETVLADRSRFARTGKVERKCRRQVYVEIETGHLWYVDNLHYGDAAHLEVFSSTAQHLGEAEIHGRAKAGTAIQGRQILW